MSYKLFTLMSVISACVDYMWDCCSPKYQEGFMPFWYDGGISISRKFFSNEARSIVRDDTDEALNYRLYGVEIYAFGVKYVGDLLTEELRAMDAILSDEYVSEYDVKLAEEAFASLTRV